MIILLTILGCGSPTVAPTAVVPVPGGGEAPADPARTDRLRAGGVDAVLQATLSVDRRPSSRDWSRVFSPDPVADLLGMLERREDDPGVPIRSSQTCAGWASYP
jgi:hypothetical protein